MPELCKLQVCALAFSIGSFQSVNDPLLKHDIAVLQEGSQFRLHLVAHRSMSLFIVSTHTDNASRRSQGLAYVECGEFIWPEAVRFFNAIPGIP